MKIKGLILAGGSGTSLRPITFIKPKQLIPVANRPILSYCVEDLLRAGIDEIGVILGDVHRKKIVAFLEENMAKEAKFTYIYQGAPRGIAHAIGCARDFIGGGRFAVYLGDNLLKSGIAALVSDFSCGDADAMILLSKVREPSRFGVAQFGEDGELEGLVEKPEEPPSDLALAGIYFLTPLIFPFIDALEPSWRGELEITDALRDMLDEGYDIEAREVTGWWKDTGRPHDILEANRLLLSEGLGEALHTGPNAGSQIAEDVCIRKPVIIGKGCKLSGGAIIGPHVSIGDDCHIRGAEISDTIIETGVLIDCNRRITGSIIGAGTRMIGDGGPEGERGKVLRMVLPAGTHLEL